MEVDTEVTAGEVVGELTNAKYYKHLCDLYEIAYIDHKIDTAFSILQEIRSISSILSIDCDMN